MYGLKFGRFGGPGALVRKSGMFFGPTTSLTYYCMPRVLNKSGMNWGFSAWWLSPEAKVY